MQGDSIHQQGRSLKRDWYIASRGPSGTPPDRNYLAFAPKGIISTTPPSRGLEAASLLYQRSQRRLGTPWVGPINAARKRVKLATVQSRLTGLGFQ